MKNHKPETEAQIAAKEAEVDRLAEADPDATDEILCCPRCRNKELNVYAVMNMKTMRVYTYKVKCTICGKESAIAFNWRSRNLEDEDE